MRLASRWFWLPTALITVGALCLCFVPLFNVLGYEFCFVLGLATGLTGAAIGLGAGSQATDGLDGLTRALPAAILHLLPTLALISLNALRVRNCNYSFGLQLFVLLPLASALYGATLGVAVARVFHGTRPRVRVVALAFALVIPLVLRLTELYREPPIFVFDHLFGYFAGSLYDEVITIDARLVAFRLLTILRIGSIAACFSLAHRRLRLAYFVPLAVALVVTTLGVESKLGPRLGFRLTRADIEAELSTVVTRPGLVVHLPPRVSVAQAQDIANDHAFRLWQIKNQLGVETLPTVASYVYATPEQKARLMGGRDSMIAKPWLLEVHIHSVVAPHPLLAHELTHVVAATFARAPLRISSRYGVVPNMGLVEGLAEAISPPRGEYDVDTWTRALRDIKMAPDVRALVGPRGFWTAAPQQAYVVAGSFVGFLLRRHGKERFRQLYAAGDFSAAYRKDLSALVTEWEQYIDGLAPNPSARSLAAEQFSHPSIFSRVCAHEISTRRDLAQRASASEAVALYRELACMLDNTPASQVDLALALARNDDEQAFMPLVEALLADHRLTTGLRNQLLAARADFHWRHDRQTLALADIVASTSSAESNATKRLHWIQIWALAQPPEVSQTIRDLLDQRVPKTAALVALADRYQRQPTNITLGYLMGRQLEQADACKLAVRYLRSEQPHPAADIETERLRLLATCNMKLGDYVTARRNLQGWSALASTSGDAARARDSLARLAWMEQTSAKSVMSQPASTHAPR